jgi:phosphatidylglycerol lysyltransferase
MKVIKVVFPLTILIVLYIEGKKQIQSINLPLVFEKIQDIGLVSFLWLVLLGILAVGSMIFYDLFVVRNLKLNIPAKKIILSGFSANSYANFMGFGGFAGVGLRTLFYRKYSNKLPRLLKSITIILPYMLIGLSVFAWGVLAYEWSAPILLKEYPILKLPVLIMCGYGFFIVLAGHFSKSLTFTHQLALIVVSLLEWLSAACVFWQIASVLNIEIPITALFILFFMAAIAGVLSTVPGGVGAFDFVILVGLASFGISEEKLVALLFLYRLVYYIVPFFLSSIIFIHFMFKEKAWKYILPEKKTWAVISHRLLFFWVLIVGVVLVLFPVIPAIVRRIKIANEFLSMEMMQISQQFSITIGITLLVLARVIEDRVKRAYYFTFFILSIGIIVSFSKGFHFWEALMLSVAMLLLFFSRKLFYRERSQYTIGKGLIDGIILLSISLIYVVVGSLQISYIQRIVPRRLQDLFSLDPQSLWHDVGFGIIMAVFLLFFGLFFRTGVKSASLFKPASIKDNQAYRSLFQQRPLYVFTGYQGRILYQRWMDNLVLIKRVDPNEQFQNMDILLCKQFESEIDKYGYVLIVPKIKEEEKSAFINAGFQLVEEESTWFALSESVPQIVAKTNIKWLNRIINKVY